MDPQTDLSHQELHLLYVLLDSNLPTGGFVASSGLESFAKHGFLSSVYSYASDASSSLPEGKDGVVGGRKNVMLGLVDFARAEVANYGSTTGGFVRDAWACVESAREELQDMDGMAGHDAQRMSETVEKVLKKLQVLDKYHETTLLSHVGRRASEPQGVAMLTLFSRGLSHPRGIEEGAKEADELERLQEEFSERVVEGYKKLVRLEKVPGHLAVCWGLMAAALRLPLDRTVHLHLFMHARSLLSSAVRLNLIGPYASSQLLLHPYREIIEREVKKLEKSTTGILESKTGAGEEKEDHPWAWVDDAERGPETTWPLGEVLMGRHDLQHSAIFNS